MHQKYLAVGVGEVLWDLLPDGRQLGGAPANFAYHVQAFGATAVLLSAVGADALGTELRQRLQTAGIETRFMNIDLYHPTSTVEVTLDAHGHASYNITEQVAWDYMDLDREHTELAARCDIVCFGSLAQRTASSAAAIRAFVGATPARAMRIFDVNLRQHYYSTEIIASSLELANVLKLNDDELPVLAAMFALPAAEPAVQLQQLRRIFDLQLVALTCGGNGCILAVPEQTLACPAVATAVVDTVGAGDSFTAALAMAWKAQLPLAEIGALANRTAAYVCGHAGATVVLPPAITDALRRDPV